MSLRSSAWVGFIALVAIACTERNPEYCGDGTCIDPAKPFCDIDGSYAGTPGTCIAVSCTPGEFSKCRDDLAITCNGAGTNYDLLHCEMGCDPDASGCRACTSNAQCSATDVCDMSTSHCRGCTTDDECDSRVCDLQAAWCVPEESVLYASPTGSGTCSLTQPCSLMKAYVQAANSTPKPIVRMLPGNYTSPLQATFATGDLVYVVATGANMIVIGDKAAIVVDGGAKIDIRNLTSTSERLVQCGLASTDAPISSVRLQDSMLTMVGNSVGLQIQRCELSMYNVEFFSASTMLGTADDSAFSADRLYVHAREGSGTLIIAGARVTVDVVNSVLDYVQLVAFLNDTGPPGTSLRFAYSTILLADSTNICNGTLPSYVSFAFENSILAVASSDDVFASTTACRFTSTLLTRQASPPPGTTVGDPKFVNFAARDFHLSSGSPAIDAATAGSRSTDHDLEGAPRPQGSSSDLGAYEFRP